MRRELRLSCWLGVLFGILATMEARADRFGFTIDQVQGVPSSVLPGAIVKFNVIYTASKAQPIVNEGKGLMAAWVDPGEGAIPQSGKEGDIGRSTIATLCRPASASHIQRTQGVGMQFRAPDMPGEHIVVIALYEPVKNSYDYELVSPVEREVFHVQGQEATVPPAAALPEARPVRPVGNRRFSYDNLGDPALLVGKWVTWRESGKYAIIERTFHADGRMEVHRENDRAVGARVVGYRVVANSPDSEKYKSGYKHHFLQIYDDGEERDLKNFIVGRLKLPYFDLPEGTIILLTKGQRDAYNTAYRKLGD